MNTATFSSTMLVNITSNDPKEISDQVNKALNDVLSKLNNLSNSINTTQTQAQATYAPLPQSAAGVGQGDVVQSGVGSALLAPAGGFWWIISTWYQLAATGVLYASGQTSPQFVSGGAQILPAYAANYGVASILRIA